MLIILLMVANPAVVMAETDKNQIAHQKVYANQDKIAFAIQKTIEKMATGQKLEIEGETIFSANILPEFYKNRDYRPAWSNYATLLDAFTALRDSWQDGLNPNDYHADGIHKIIDMIEQKLAEKEIDYTWVAQSDILTTDAVLLYAYHLLKGKVDPESLDPSWNYSFREINKDAPYELQQAIANGQVAEDLHRLRPTMPLYKSFMELLVAYRQTAADGGWKRIPEGQVIKPGTSDARIPLIRQRLAKTGRLSDHSNPASIVYDQTLEGDIKQFQRINALEPDGVIGKGTLEVLNETVEQRIAKLRVNMERLRWIVSDLSERFILVNIPAFKAYYLENNVPRFTTNVQVGKPYTKTPVFKSRLHYIEFNPTWTVPRSIIKNSILDHIASDPNYLDQHNFELLDHAGNVVPNSRVNGKQLSPANFPYTVRQKPGADNSLGVVKFIFPNKYAVFMHDTPSKSLFNRQDRAFSHGCIRTQNPLELAAIILEKTEWTPEKINALIETRKRTRVFPQEDIDVLLLYLTSAYYDTDEQKANEVGFFRDIYERDAMVLERLNAAH